MRTADNSVEISLSTALAASVTKREATTMLSMVAIYKAAVKYAGK